MKLRHISQAVLVFVCTLLSTQTQAQLSIKPLAFDGNYYKDYVNSPRFLVSAPSSIARECVYTIASDPSSSTPWGGTVATPIIDVAVAMAPTGSDTFACSALPGGSLAGKIALIWRSPSATGGCEFGYKALQAENAGAIACVIINHGSDDAIGMGVGTTGGASVTIPVFMIGRADGLAITNAYHTLPAGTVKMSFLPWSQGLTNDLGIVPGGAAPWAYGAIPAFQIPATESTPAPYKLLDGAFIANYGTAAASNVKLITNVTYTPTTGAASSIHTSTVNMTPATFPAADSIWALFSNEADVTGVTGTGRIDITYSVSATATDNNPSDNSYTLTTHVTDSTFCKTRYDAVNKHPIVTAWYFPGSDLFSGEYMWGVPFYVKHGNCVKFRDIQFSAASNSDLMLGLQEFHVFEWVPSGAGDSTMEGSELTQIGYAVYGYDGVLDSSRDYFTTLPITDPISSTSPVYMADNKWYVVATQGQAGIYMGCDGVTSSYPRAYGRRHVSGAHELYNPHCRSNLGDMLSGLTPINNYAGGGGIMGNNSANVDSLHFMGQKRMAPAFAVRVTPPLPPSPGSTMGPTRVCVGSTITLTTTVSGGTWSTGATTASVSSLGVVTGISPGTAVITYTVGDVCTTAIATRLITVNALPTPTITAAGTVLSTTTAYTTYQWVLGGSPISGATDATYTATTTGSYSVTVTDANGCTGTSAAFDLSEVSVRNAPIASNVTLYPNPVTNMLYVKGTGQVNIRVYNLIGQLMAEAKNTNKISLAELPAGMYMVQLNGQHGEIAYYGRVTKQ